MILLLTSCINPGGMPFTAISNPQERERQYVKALNFYISHTTYPIVFTENSGTDISHLFEEHIRSGRLECLTFCGNNNKYQGKGYGECEIIQYALDHSQLIRSCKHPRIAKITGRLIVRNLSTIVRMHSCIFSKRTILCAVNSDLSFPDSRFFIAPIEFLRLFLMHKEGINDNKGRFFEHILGETIKAQTSFPFSPFLTMPQIEGCSGSTGTVYNASPQTLSFMLTYAKYALWQRKKFKKLYRP